MVRFESQKSQQAEEETFILGIFLHLLIHVAYQFEVTNESSKAETM